MGTEIFTALALALTATQALELALCLLLGYRSRRVLLVVVLANLLTNPAAALAYSLLPVYYHFPKIPLALALELATVVIEWLCYKYRAGEIRHPLLFSLAANCFSYFTGLFVQFLL